MEAAGYLIENEAFKNAPGVQQGQWKEETELCKGLDAFAARFGKEGPIRLEIHNYDVFKGESWAPMTLREVFKSVLLYDRKIDEGLLPTMSAAWTSDTVEFFADERAKPVESDVIVYAIGATGNLLICATIKDACWAAGYGKSLNSTLKEWSAGTPTDALFPPGLADTKKGELTIAAVDVPQKDHGVLVDNAGSLRADALHNLLEMIDPIDKALNAEGIAEINGSSSPVTLIVEDWDKFLLLLEEGDWHHYVGNKLRDMFTTFGFGVLDPQGGGSMGVDQVKFHLLKLWTTGVIRLRVDAPQGWAAEGVDPFEYTFEEGDLVASISSTALKTFGLNFVGSNLRFYVHEAVGGPPARKAGKPVPLKIQPVKKECKHCKGTGAGTLKGKCKWCAGKGYSIYY